MEQKLDIQIQSINDEVAYQNRQYFDQIGLLVLNMISSPGSGKTSILEVMAQTLGKKLHVITGDVQTDLDAERLVKAGAKAFQIQTGGSCHLTASMVQKALRVFDIEPNSLLVIENIGNLVCPSTYNLGEHIKIAVVSTAEGDEKPIKYPALFTRAQAVLVNKIDLLPYVAFNIDRLASDCYKLNNKVRIFKTSCVTKEGFGEWMDFLYQVKKSLG
ncbi:MAG: hydrogenase nickel incorporation protein HypB [Candidatus Brocadiae bacterium]|nr:hydrogenase nickel incorporation protein HypB [Candidatus Brocadiia bacterium]